MKSIKLNANERVFKVSMSRQNSDIDNEAFDYFNKKKLIVIHRDTKAIGRTPQSQGNIFSEQMKIGDYFYMCRGNEYLKVIGRITSEAEKCEYADFGDSGWLQRSYDIIAEVKKGGQYKGSLKWWAPSGVTTCAAIPQSEIDDANEEIFNPFFDSQFEYEESHTDKISKNKSDSIMTSTPPLNQILFGPPGTGKTYKTINKAIAIINPTFDLTQERKEVKKEFDRLMREGQIVFTTFHQNMSYEDFIEGIKPKIIEQGGKKEVIYDVVPGIFKKLCERITDFEKLTSNFQTTVVSISSFDELYSAFANKLREIVSELEESETHSFESRQSRVKLLRIEDDNSILTIGENAKTPETITKEKMNRIYDRFGSLDEITKLEKIREEVGKDISWATNYYAVFKALKDFEFSINTPENENSVVKNKQNFVLIIDEINRGNVSQIFGELITLIEEDKRLGKDEALEVTLPYSKKLFGVPSNLFIIGTMNTADRSVEALDTALRRRFSFEEMPSNPKLIATEGTLKSAKGLLGGIDLPHMLEIINKRIEKLLDKDHQIGHSYFLSIKNSDDLKAAFQNKIIPLLQEYFFGDYGKIGLVIGGGFVEVVNDTEDTFASFSDYDTSNFEERSIYRIKNVEKMDEEVFFNALKTLMT